MVPTTISQAHYFVSSDARRTFALYQRSCRFVLVCMVVTLRHVRATSAPNIVCLIGGWYFQPRCQNQNLITLAAFLVCIAIAIYAFFIDWKVVGKERANRLYGVTAFFILNAIIGILLPLVSASTLAITTCRSFAHCLSTFSLFKLPPDTLSRPPRCIFPCHSHVRYHSYYDPCLGPNRNQRTIHLLHNAFERSRSQVPVLPVCIQQFGHDNNLDE